jgi:hypothetical protein
MSNSQAPTHWSKDFVEHLRTVHFALIAISAGLILLVFSSKPFNSVTALRELEEIIELQTLWSADSFDPLTSGADLAFNLGDEGVPLSPDLPNQKIVATVRSMLTSRRVLAQYVLVLPQNKWFVLDSRGQVDLTRRPTNVGEFEGWWNALQRPNTVIVPLTLCPFGSVFEPTGETSKEKAASSLTEEVQLTTSEKVFNAGAAFPSKVMRLIQPPFSRESGFVADLEAHGKLFFSICETRSSEVSQEGVTAYFTNWRRGAFIDAFYDLDRAAREYKTLKLERLDKLLSDEASKGPEAFEAFGMKFPAGEITFWGVILLLSVQLYLLVYLRQLFGKLKSDDPGWDVPWIGMDSSQVSQTIVYVSVVILPCLSAILLGWKATVRLSSGYWERTEQWFRPVHFLAPLWHWHYSVLLKIFLLALAAIASGYLGFLSWKYRPQIVPEPPSRRLATSAASVS